MVAVFTFSWGLTVFFLEIRQGERSWKRKRESVWPKGEGRRGSRMTANSPCQRMTSEESFP